VFGDEVSSYAESVLDALAADHGAFAPFIGPLEVSNVFLVGKRRGRIAETQSTSIWELRKAMPITVDERAPMTSSDAIVALGRGHGLSAYAAACLGLAVRNATHVATRDDKLIGAACASGVALRQAQATRP